MSLPASDDQVLLLHNPRCSKSRATEQLLVERGAAFEERRYLEDPLTRAELEQLAAR
jgi:arsenate reductase